ncbi:MAG: fumarylacetoacetate hydrolase family protein [Bacteroidia bacterium]|nr:fumarylacetoacetate hydrolase family protein [Bacteroidia bacterium]MDW8345622.1 fumarylacetoacetate hydrolase family protein [Bacteroidia bacterium]
MKLVSFIYQGKISFGFYFEGQIFDLREAGIKLHFPVAESMKDFLWDWDRQIEYAQKIELEAKAGNLSAINPEKMLAPVPFPTSCRDGYAFRQHVEAARRNRKVPMIPEFDQYPIFYFTNHNAIQGEGDIEVLADHLQKLDFELEAAVVICKKGRNIPASKADEYIGGYMIMNDMSARVLQMEEMLLNLGPAKGKDFCTVIGPWLVTKDELKPYKIPPHAGHEGEKYNLEMKCWVNGKLVSQGNMADMDWTFAEIIERCAYGVDILPGDVIGSGTVGTGCFLELNGTGKLHDPNYPEQWLQDGDIVEMEITGLGHLTNRIKKVGDYSILAKKKLTKNS